MRRLAREKLLVPGYRYSWEWKHHRTAEVQASIQLEVGEECITFRYQISDREQSGHVAQQVLLVTTPCHYGRHRYWFACPYCGRRVALLYLGFKPACQRCNRMAYKVQREGAHDREIRRLDNIRERLGWEAGFLNGPGRKPKGMHLKTYQRLLALHTRLEQSIMGHVSNMFGLELGDYQE